MLFRRARGITKNVGSCSETRSFIHFVRNVESCKLSLPPAYDRARTPTVAPSSFTRGGGGWKMCAVVQRAGGLMRKECCCCFRVRSRSLHPTTLRARERRAAAARGHLLPMRTKGRNVSYVTAGGWKTATQWKLKGGNRGRSYSPRLYCDKKTNILIRAAALKGENRRCMLTDWGRARNDILIG